jgi:hypothetical protein
MIEKITLALVVVLFISLTLTKNQVDNLADHYLTKQEFEKRMPLVVHDTNTVIRYEDRFIHDTIRTTKTEYVETATLNGKFQEFSNEEYDETLNVSFESEDNLMVIPTKHVLVQCSGKIIEDEDGDPNTCVGEWIIRVKEEIDDETVN